ncbi:MAG: TatD family deoxyribonuclease [Phycisphaerales bacterium]|nr:MAG: TatD family deoxyribonuclease [Phycisphaerales bacterium]
MTLIDSHAHLTDESLVGQLDEVMARCAEAGVEHVITVCTDGADIDQGLAVAQRFPGRVSVCAGLHPHHADGVTPADLETLRRHLDFGRVVAVGEMGLDYHYDFADPGRQRDVFASQLQIAAGFDLPVVIHCREALADCVPVLLDGGMAGRRVVFHCFTGTAEEAAQVAEHGWRISFTGVVTFKSSGALQEIARTYPADRLMVETDSPYLSPVPVRGRRPNEPAHVAHVARFLAELRGVEYESLCRDTWENTREFFRLPGSETRCEPAKG